MTERVSEKTTGRPGLTLALLFCMFAIPPVLAWYLLNFTQVGVSSGTVNNGQLIHPARTLAETNLYDAYAEVERPLYGKWNMIYFHDGECDDVCLEKLYRMQQVRLATSKYAHRLQRVIVLNAADENKLLPLLKDYQGLLVMRRDELSDEVLRLFQMSTDDDIYQNHRVYIVDPIGNLMMFYEPESEPKGMIKDLQRLIKLSRIG